jgi:hypothetical protein
MIEIRILNVDTEIPSRTGSSRLQGLLEKASAAGQGFSKRKRVPWLCRRRIPQFIHRKAHSAAHVGAMWGQRFIVSGYALPLLKREMVPKKGLEPPHPCEYVDLNHARLPIPPLRPLK